MSVPNNADATGILGFDTNCGNPGGKIHSGETLRMSLGAGITIADSFGGMSYSEGGSYDYVMIPSGSCQPTDSTTVLAAHFPVDR